MMRLLSIVALAALAGCTKVVVDESKVFAPVAFDAAVAANGEVIQGDRGYASAEAWGAAWKAKVEKGVLIGDAPQFVLTAVEHGRLQGKAGGLAWSMLSRPAASSRLIVRCGGNASTRQKNGFVYSVTALDYGDVLLFDYPGSGETAGEVSTQRFEAMTEDLVAFIREKAAGRQLVLWGHSLGGFVCSELAERLPETAGIVLETSARNAAEVAKAWTPWYAGPFVQIDIAPGLGAYDNVNSLKAFKGPVLVLGATLDKTLPVQLARSLNKALEAAGVDVTYVEFKDGAHSNLPGQAGFSPAIASFFGRLKAQP
jgi:pimeloyl-ACP methyl ester carboxylesterase